MFQYSFTERTVPVPVSVPGTTVPAVPVPRSVPAKSVPTVPVSGSGSVPGPPCIYTPLQCWEVLPFCRFQAPAVYKNQGP